LAKPSFPLLGLAKEVKAKFICGKMINKDKDKDKDKYKYK
jgi:hypothetical protein